MTHSNTFINHLATGFLVITIGLHSPAGHDLIYSTMLRAWFVSPWIQASLNTGHMLSFQTFRENAEIFAYHENSAIFKNNMRLLKSKFSFCLPQINDDGDESPYAPQSAFACHVATTRNEKSEREKLAL